MKATIASLIALLTTATAVYGQDSPPRDPSDATTAPLKRPRDPNDSLNYPSPPSSSRERAIAGTAPGGQDSFVALQDAYKAALAKALNDYKAAIQNCTVLVKSAQKSCREQADVQLKIAKSEAQRLKPVS